MLGANFVSRTVQLSLHCLGVFDNRKYGIVYSIIIITLCSISISGSVIGILNSTGAANKLESATSLFPQLNAVLLFLSVNLSQNSLLRLLAQLKKFSISDNILEQSNKFTKNELIGYFITMAIQCVCFATPSLIAPFMEGEISDKYSLVIPFWFSCGELDGNQRTVEMCWRIRSKKELFVANRIQGMLASLPMMIYGASFALYGVIVGELMVHFKSIKILVSQFNEKNEPDLIITKRISLVKFQHHQKKNYKYLLEIVEYQKFLHNCILKTINIWKPYLTCIYGAFTINLTTFLFISVREQSNSKSFVIKVTFLTLFGVLIAFLLASYSQKISTLNETIFDELINLKWYGQSLEFRKIYLMLNLTLKPVRVIIGGAFQINLNSFLGILRVVYSVLNVLIIKYQ